MAVHSAFTEPKIQCCYLKREYDSLAARRTPYVTYHGPLESTKEVSSQAVEFKRMIQDKSILTITSYGINKRMNNSVVKLADGTYGKIEKIVCDSSNFLILTPLKCLPAQYEPFSLSLRR